MLLRPLYESWLLRATRTPLAPWQRALLLRALERDEALRCLALELAEFSHEEEAPADLHAPDLRVRLRAYLESEPAPAYGRPRWALGLAAALGVVIGLAAFVAVPKAPLDVEVAQVQQPETAQALALPTETSTPTESPTPSVTPSPTALPATPTPTPAP